MRLVQEAAERYEVCFLDSDIASDGGKIRLSAGAPRVVGDDEERMLLALRQIVEADPPLPVRVGVNRGPVFTGDGRARLPAVVRGHGRHREPRRASDGQGAGRSHLRHARGPAAGQDGFQQTALEPFSVKGKVAARAGLGRRPAGPRGVEHRRSGPSCRWSAVTVSSICCATAIAAARRGAGALIELVGETGSGKSRLLAEAGELGEGMRCSAPRARWYTRDTPYFPGAICCASCSVSDGTTPKSVVLAGSRPRSSAASPI